MIGLIQKAFADQYGAALKMLQGCIGRCDTDQWTGIVGQFPFWHVAYHVLFYTDLYLSPSESAFRPQAFHRENYNFFGAQPWPPFRKVVADQPYDKDTLLEYVRICMGKADEVIVHETEATLAGPSGFHWLPFDRAQLHIYNIRHVQHHAGQLGAFLIREQGEDVPWVGSHSPKSLSG